MAHRQSSSDSGATVKSMADEMTGSYSAQAEALFVRIRTACPTFVRIDDAEEPNWHDDTPLGYYRIARLADHLAQLAAEGRMALVAPVLALAEEALATGDKYTRDLVAVGLLEDLQADCLRIEGHVKLLDVRALLGPKSRAAWDELIGFWWGPPDLARKRLPPGSLPDEKPEPA